MNLFDFIILFIISFFILKGAYKGLIKQLFSLLSIIAGTLVALAFYNTLYLHLGGYFDNSPLAKPIIFIILFIISSLLINYIGILLTNASKYLALGTLNRLLGSLFGLLQALILIILIAFVYEYLKDHTSLSEPFLIKNSHLYPYIQKTTTALLDFISGLL